MVIGLLAITAIPTVTGVGQAVSAQQRQQAACKEQQKFNMTAMMPMKGELREAAFCVLVDDKVSFPTQCLGPWQRSLASDHEQIYLNFPERKVDGHLFSGYYFNYPGEEPPCRGLVSTISEDPPMLNWIYVDKDTQELKYGGKKVTVGHVIGPWGWSADEHFLVLKENAEPFVARREDDGRWAVYWDPEGKLEDTQTLRLRRRLQQQGVESRFVKG